MAVDQTARQKLIREVYLRLGGEMIEVELTPEHYDLAVDMAMDRYRQRSSNSVSEKLAFLDLQPEQSEYVLPKEVSLVKQIYRRGTSGTASGTGVAFDPFGAAFVNQSSVGLGTGSGSLLTYELYAGFQETVGRMFGLFINYTWNETNHTLTITRHVKAKETILMQIYVTRSEEETLRDTYARPWLRDYVMAQCMLMMAHPRGKFASMVGPQGGSTMNAGELKAEAEAILERLEREVSTQVEQAEGYGFIIG